MFKKSKKDRILSDIKHTFDAHPLLRFLSILLIIVGYGFYVSQSQGYKSGFLISVLTWSFFVLCTPIADAGILIDLPIRLVTGLKMIYSEIIVWTVAISLNFFVLANSPQIYEQTIVLTLFKYILKNPIPYWLLIVLSCVGTFFSLYIADTIIDPKKQSKQHKSFLKKHKIIISLFLVVLVIAIYDMLLNKLGIDIPLV